jgi:hypothetical protein|tara:strand:- start:4108 stop:4443 length:336 start_codon:yes stop_codon:yes gene_type:complete
MAKFISMLVVANSNDYENGQQLLNVEQITGVQQSADDVVEVYVNGGTPGDKITLTLTTDPTGIAAPVMTTNLGANAINRALTANPGGVKATVNWGVDDNGDQMYVRNVAFA